MNKSMRPPLTSLLKPRILNKDIEINIFFFLEKQQTIRNLELPDAKKTTEKVDPKFHYLCTCERGGD